MEFKKLANNTINFGINRIIETAGIALVVIGLLLLVSLATFSPDDPNFIFPDNTEIKNLLGFNGSYTADLFFQTFGLIALLIPFTLIFSGMNIVLNKKIFLIFESIFYSVLYSSFGSLFFSFFYPAAFNLYINGNGGFIGKYLETTFLASLINVNSQISYYLLILIILILFLIIKFTISPLALLAKKEITFNSPFLRSLNTGVITGLLNLLSCIALLYSSEAKLIISSSFFNSDRSALCNLFSQNLYKLFPDFVFNFVPISNR